MSIPLIMAWAGFLGFVLLMLAFDLFVLHRNPHEIRLREALLGTLVPVAAALAFMGVLYFAYQNHYLGLGVQPPGMDPRDDMYFPDSGAEAVILFLTGYLVELSLSADNVFLFVVLMGYFAVPVRLQHRVLFWGVLGALIMRGLMIGSVSVLVQFHIVIYAFGIFLLFTGIKMLFTSDEKEANPGDSLIVRAARRILPIHPHYDGHKFLTRVNGRTMATTLLLVLIAIEFTDLIFALDSIPAIFGITKDPYIVFTSNVFAILGLRSMYFLLAGVIDKFHLLRYGLAIVLAFVGVKMVLPGIGELYSHFIDHQPHPWTIGKYLSLTVIVGVLAISVIASLLFPEKPKPPV